MELEESGRGRGSAQQSPVAKKGEGRTEEGESVEGGRWSEPGGGLTTVLLRAQFTGLPPTLCRVLAAAALGLRGVESFGH